MDKLKEIAEENQKKILFILRSGPKTWRELKELTKFSDRTLAKHLKSLLEKGLITEEIDRKDRRRKIYRLSDKGLEFLKEDILSLLIFFEILKSYNEARTKWNEKFTKEILNSLSKKGESTLLLSRKDEEEARFVINELKDILCKLFLEATFRGGYYLRALFKSLDMFQTFIENHLIYGRDRAYPFKYAALQILESKILNIDSLPEKEKIERLETKIEQLVTLALTQLRIYEKMALEACEDSGKKYFEILKNTMKTNLDNFYKALEKIDNPILRDIIEKAWKKAEENVKASLKS